MELEEFIETSLVQIVRGIEAAERELRESNATVSPRYRTVAFDSGHVNVLVEDATSKASRPVDSVEFDVAVVAVEGKEKKGGIGVFVGSVGIGGQGKSETSSSSHSRIKFTVPIALPIPN